MASSEVGGVPVFMARYADKPSVSSLWDEPVKLCKSHISYIVGLRYLAGQ